MRASRYLLLPIFFITAFCSSARPTADVRKTFDDYRQILAHYDTRLEKNLVEQGQAVTYRELLAKTKEFQALQSEKESRLDRLLTSIAGRPETSEDQWLKMKLLGAGGHLEKALALCESFMATTPTLAAAAKWEKIKILNRQNRVPEAISLFRQIEPAIPKNADLYNTYMLFALYAAEAATRQEYARKFFLAESLPESLQICRSRIYQRLARTAAAKGDLDGAANLLKTALADERLALWQQLLKSEIEHLSMLQKPAPPLSSENWLNPVAAKGQVQAILFWAPWSEACRPELLFLKELADRFAAKGLRVSACTKLYGVAIGDPAKEIPVSMSEESRQLQAYLARLGISYPVLVAPEGKEFTAFRVAQVPTLVLVDRQGLITDMLIPDGGSHEQIIQKTAALLGDR